MIDIQASIHSTLHATLSGIAFALNDVA